jgi:hypothetical protein
MELKPYQQRAFQKLMRNARLDNFHAAKPYFFTIEEESFYAIQFLECTTCVQKKNCRYCFQEKRHYYDEYPDNISIMKIMQEKFILTN